MCSINQEPTDYPEINKLLLDLHRRAREILDDRFVGMYLYGSLAGDDFEPSRSDIDFVVITDNCDLEARFEPLKIMHLELQKVDMKWAMKLEGAYVPKSIIQKHDPDHPPVPTLNEGHFYMSPLGSDWVIQRETLRSTNKVISGPSLRNMIDPITRGGLIAAIHEVIDNWWEPMLKNPSRLQDPGYQPFAVLSMCRSLYTLKIGELASKSEAANWAIDTLPLEWHALIRHAVHWGYGDEIESVDRTIEFMQYAIGLGRENDFGAPI